MAYWMQESERPRGRSRNLRTQHDLPVGRACRSGGGIFLAAAVTLSPALTDDTLSPGYPKFTPTPWYATWPSQTGKAADPGAFDAADILGAAVADNDMPQDGYPDIVVCTYRSLTILRNLQTWDPNDPNDPNDPYSVNCMVFHRQLSTGSSLHHLDVKLADVTDDRKRDIVTVAGDGIVRIYLNHGDGTFGDYTSDPNSPSPSAQFSMTESSVTMNRTQRLVVTDVSNDGVREILVAGSIEASQVDVPTVGVAFRPSGGWGASTPAVDLYSDTDFVTPCLDIATGPFRTSTQSGYPDFVASFEQDVGLGVGQNDNSAGSFTPMFTSEFGAISKSMTTNLFRPAVTYFDAIELTAAQFVGDVLQPLENDGTGSFDNLNPIKIEDQLTENVFGLASGKLNIDGYMDLAVTGRTYVNGSPGAYHGKVVIYRGKGNLDFWSAPRPTDPNDPNYALWDPNTPAPVVLEAGPDNVPKYVKIVDMNLDCRPDIVTVGEGHYHVNIWQNLMQVSCD